MSYVSIIVPVFNVEHLITRCLNSIINQTFTDFEVIVINDGSTDSSGSICVDFAKRDQRIKYIQIENSGLSAARNLGIEKASGNFLFFADSDDYLDTDLLKKIVSCQKKYNCEIVKFSATITSEENASMNLHSNNIKVYTSKEAINQYFYGDKTQIKVQVWSGLYKRILFSDIRFPEGQAYEDNYITPVILSKAEKIVFIDYPGYFYYIREGSIMHSGFTREKALAYNLYKKLYFAIVPRYPEFSELLIEKWIYQFIYTYRQVIKSKNKNNKIVSMIYKEIKNDKKFLLEKKLSSSCKRQLLLFLLSPVLFNMSIDFIEWREKRYVQ